ncbi:CoA transferase [Rhodococcus sp. 14C212]|uniref:CaiB/BaiF CoA transferase family protein n=1 Tax=Rhodococcus sp. 14C212 TaxID=2711209 RepID=UPI0013ECBAFF|nr:CoA transferase [Rhodococcus sp. 14C212]NGP08692.1 CoA transferase [Rhodococcus sp. 14C212]
MELAFSGLRVVEIADDPAGEYAGKLLADQGATVVKVEPIGGATSRRIGPWAHGTEDPDHSLNFWTYNTSKQSVVLADDDQGRAARAALIAEADIVLTTGRPVDLAAAGLDLEALCTQHSKLIALSISPFGLTGPWANYLSSDLVGLAAGGLLNSCGYDDHSIPPIRPGGNQGYMTAASFALCGVVLALIERQQTGRGQLVDVSMHESIAVTGELANPYWFYPKAVVKRQTCRHAQPSPTQSALFQCADGVWVYFALILADQFAWKALTSWMDEIGLVADLAEEAFDSLAYRQENFAHIQGLLEAFFMIQDSETVYRDGQKWGLPIGPLRAPEEVLRDEHLAARNFFVDVTMADGSTTTFPGAPYRFSNGYGDPHRPPMLGEHTEEVLAHD